jgi:hypothetical protein
VNRWVQPLSFVRVKYVHREFAADAQATALRIERLQAYFDEHVMTNGRFICSTQKACIESHRGAFYKGQLPHVGTHYDLTRNGTPFRIVVVGQEYGDECELVDLNARRAMIESSGWRKRFFAEPGFPPRNPHMKGCTSVLRVLFGKELGRDREGEFVQLDRTSIHLFDCFAPANFLLCSAVPSAGSTQGRSTSTMHKNCARHFVEQLELLEPTITVLQGRSSVLKWMKATFDGLSDEIVQTVQINGCTTRVLAFTHPSAHEASNWGANDQTRYLHEVVEPKVKQVLREWDAQAGTTPRKTSSGRAEVKTTLGWKEGDPIQSVNLRCTQCGYFAKTSNEMLSRGRLKCPVDGEVLATKEERGEKKGRW